jgi:hypothetical protein
MRFTCCSLMVAGLLSVVAPEGSQAQVMYLSEQSVQPVYEGYNSNPDDSYTMWFGYLNRNHAEQPHLPIGPNNFFTVVERASSLEEIKARVEEEEGRRGSDLIDRGQPTHFYPRRQGFVFGVTVPEDFGSKVLVWSLRRDGESQTETAVGKIQPEFVWALNQDIWRANRRATASESPNQPPSLEVVGKEMVTVAVGEAVTLTVSVSDDGLPEAPEPGGQSGGSMQAPLPNNLPSIHGSAGEPTRQVVVSAAATLETGMAVTWIHYRGQGEATFDPMVVSIDNAGGTATTLARFRGAGTHEVRAFADDGLYLGSVGVTVVVEDYAR